LDTNFYDVIVCGGETSGLIAGALLARRGFRVMVLGHEPALAAFDAGGTTLCCRRGTSRRRRAC
jgi:2-polyprenyl-6-methoxyphenol hydroxylase-like FAD-dependent oxidoreductase